MKFPLPVSRAVPGLSGHGLVLANAADAATIANTLQGHDFMVATVDLGQVDGLRAAQRLIAERLALPETAGRNLDALADSLRDLAVWCPDRERIVLFLLNAQVLLTRDLPGWQQLTGVLAAATDDLWRGNDSDRAFETVALIDGFGVPRLPHAGAEA